VQLETGDVSMTRTTDAAAVAAAARQAHSAGDSWSATALFRALLRHYPVAPEALDAQNYLETYGRRYEPPAPFSGINNPL
jgi:hypothetical protein